MKKEALEKIANGFKLLQEGCAKLAECYMPSEDTYAKDEETVEDEAEEPVTNDKPSKAKVPAPEPVVQKATISIEQVRAVLAELSRDGHQVEVKALIAKHGADKLTALNPDCYAELLKEAEAI